VSAVTAATWEESEHPRHGRGSPGGGRFKTADDVRKANREVDLVQEESDTAITLRMISTKERGQGYASRALDDLISYSEQEGKPIYLHPESIDPDGLSTSELRTWYKRHGFANTRRSMEDLAEEGSMVYRPKSVTAAGWDPAEHPRHPRGTEAGGEFAPKFEALVEPMPGIDTLSQFMEEIEEWPDTADSGSEAREYANGALHHPNDKSYILITVRDQDGNLVGVGDAQDVGASYLYGGSFGAIKGGGLPLFNAFLEEAERRGEGATWTAGNARAKALYMKMGVPQQFQPSMEEYEEYGDQYSSYEQYLESWDEEFGNEFSLTADQVRILSADMFAFAKSRSRETAREQEVEERRGMPYPPLFSSADWPVLFASGWDESKHPRWPEGHPHGGEFRPKGGFAGEPDDTVYDFDDMSNPFHTRRIQLKVGQAKNFREELGQWYYGQTGNPPDIQAILDNWGNWTMAELYDLRVELNKNLHEGGWITDEAGNKRWTSSGLLSADYAKDIGRSLSQARNEARRLLGQVEKAIAIEQFGLEEAQQLYPELFEIKAPKVKAPNPRDQGIPEIYLSEKGTFKPGYDAKLKSDLVNSVVDLHPTERKMKYNPTSPEIKQGLIDDWKSRNPDRLNGPGDVPWTDEEIWPIAQHDVAHAEGTLYDAYMKERKPRYVRESTLLHRFERDQALKILEERGWTKYLEQKEAKVGVAPQTLTEVGQKRYDGVLKRWGDHLEVRGGQYAQIQDYVLDLDHVPQGVLDKLKEADQKVYLGPGPSTDLDELWDLAEERGRGWGNTKLDKVRGFYSPSSGQVVIATGQGGSYAVAAHEVGHAIGNVLGMDHSDRLVEYHASLYPKLAKYMKQGGKGGHAGKQEMWAEGVAVAIRRRRNVAVGMPPDGLGGKPEGPFLYRHRDDPDVEEFYQWVDAAITRLDELPGEAFRRDPRYRGVAPQGWIWKRDAVLGVDILVPEVSG
jgi:hypothetical protein